MIKFLEPLKRAHLLAHHHFPRTKGHPQPIKDEWVLPDEGIEFFPRTPKLEEGYPIIFPKPKGEVLVDYAPRNPTKTVILPTPNGGITPVSTSVKEVTILDYAPTGNNKPIVIKPKGEVLVDYAPGGGSHPKGGGFLNPREEVIATATGGNTPLGNMEEKFLSKLPSDFQFLWKKAKSKFTNVNLENIYSIAKDAVKNGAIKSISMDILNIAKSNGSNDGPIESVKDYADIINKSIVKNTTASNTSTTSTTNTTDTENKKDRTFEYVVYGVLGYLAIKKLLK